ncbi:ABC transporter permease [Bartonella sp. HY406]|uniref:ABC transporter permease n=1 Tax=Bartonella sp. HY406 TaxID=2979331 RepID=UPI0021C6CB9D|nr:ABC transporter permease [Bartonella sp. HY406]UXN03529.1 ABC transporter permease [Bartonella sp. HY406]
MMKAKSSIFQIFNNNNTRLCTLLLALILVLGLFIGDRLFSEDGLRSMALQLPELGLLSLAMMVPLLSGGINLSIIATANLSALTIAYVLTLMPIDASNSVVIFWQLGAVATGFIVAVIIGLLNGILIGYLRVSPILATLATMTLVKGLAVGLSHGTVISGFPSGIVFIGNGSVFGIPMPLALFIVTAIPMAILLGFTPLGIKIALFGSNERAVRFSGINTRKVVVQIYVISSILAFLAGLLMMARFNSANASYGESYLLVTILACVLGGVHPLGGFGKVSGVVLALIILQIISTACVVLSVSQFLTFAIWGGILIAASMYEAASLREFFYYLWRSNSIKPPMPVSSSDNTTH